MKRNNKGKPPVRPVPSSYYTKGGDSSWTESELQYMRDNREKARIIKERIFPNET